MKETKNFLRVGKYNQEGTDYWSYEQRLEVRENTRKSIDPTKVEVSVGCDPEFEYLHCSMKGDRIIFAGDIIDDDYYDSPIGRDGSGYSVEFRPVPSTNVKETVKHLKSLFAEFRNFENSRRWIDLSVSGHTYPLGGHIHFGFKTEGMDIIAYEPYLEKYLLPILDDFIGRQFLNLSGDARDDYKQYKAYELKPWGFEYRTPPAIIFQNEYLCTIILKLARNLVVKYLRNNEKPLNYKVTPSKEDYINIGGLKRKEVDFLFKEIDRLRKEVKSKKIIKAAWR